MGTARQKVSIGRQLLHCENVITLGIKPYLHDYSENARKLIYKADKIYFPSFHLYGPLSEMGKDTFPNPNYYRYFNDKIKQTHLFQSFRIPHPKTKIYPDDSAKKTILEEWAFPFIAKIPQRTSFGHGVYLIRCRDDLDAYLRKTDIAYTQEYLNIHRDLRIVLINKKVILAYWRYMPEGEFRTNVFRGGRISFDDIPCRALDFAQSIAEICDFDNVGLDICEHMNGYAVFEANMGYGIEGFRLAGINYKKVLKDMVENDEI
jgi:ribosomal protein S6--L-glutamate ligase